MMHPVLENSWFRFEADPDRASWSLKLAGAEGFDINSARTRALILDGRQEQSALETWQGCLLQPVQQVDAGIGEPDSLELVSTPDAAGLKYRVTFALPAGEPLFLWKFSIQNSGSRPVMIQRITMLDIAGSSNSFLKRKSLGFFSNGWGSWNFTGVYGAGERFRQTRLGFFRSPMRLNAGSLQPRQAGHFSGEMFGVVGDRKSRKGVLVGFLSQERHFGSLEADLRPASACLRLWANGDHTRLDPGAGIETDWACIQAVDLDAPDPLGVYLEAVARQAEIPPGRFQGEIPAGWCSWYYFYTRVRANDIRSNLEAAASLRHDAPLQLIQIDDGFETRVGDWFDFTSGFPQGVSPLAQEIRAAGFTPGLWLAPFIVDRRSRLAREHADWLLRGRFNLPVNAGYLWNNFATALDLTQPPALDYACRVVETAVKEWGFPYLKLDFLYAGALPGRRADPTLTRAQVLRRGLQALRDAAGDQIFLLGCGCPLGTGIGLVDGMRIGADVDQRWKPVILGKDIPAFWGEADLPSARNAIQNTLTRAVLHRRWWLNDPDCLLLRPDSQLSLDEVQSLATVIALTGGLVLLSDHLPDLPVERLHMAHVLLPPIGNRPVVLDWFDTGMPARLRLDMSNQEENWALIAIFNWQETPQRVGFSLKGFGCGEEGDFWLRDFWLGETFRAQAQAPQSCAVPAHGVRLFSVRLAKDNLPVYLGSDLHISQGQEMNEMRWHASEGALELSLQRPGLAAGSLDLSIPQAPRSASLNQEPLPWQELSPGVYRFAVAFERQALLRILVH